MFIGREQELNFSEEKYNASGGQLVVLYGRRRIGKTEILRKFTEGKPHVFYSCRELSDRKQLAAFSERILNKTIPMDNGKSKPISIDSEIDIVAVDIKFKNYILGECKFCNTEMGVSDLDRLKEKSSVIKKGAAVEYALFSKSGFTKGLVTQSKEDEKFQLSH